MEPFTLTLTTSDGRTCTLHCERVLRTIAGRRTVFEGVRGETAAIIKRFEDRFGWYRCRREKRGLERLEQRGLAAPKVLLAGKDEKGNSVLVIEKIAGAVSGAAAVTSAATAEAAEAVVRNVFQCVARLHEAGVIQKDLHLGNFLIADSRVYVIDPAWMRFRKEAIRQDESRRQLALLLSGLPKSLLPRQAEFIRTYCQARGFEYSDALPEEIGRLALRRRRRRLPHALKKTLRNSKYFTVLNMAGGRAVYYKEALTREDAESLIAGIAELDIAESAEAIVDCRGRRYAVRRYAPAVGVRAWLTSPARRAWLADWRAIHLHQELIPPAALLECRTGWLTKRSWLIRVAACPDEGNS